MEQKKKVIKLGTLCVQHGLTEVDLYQLIRMKEQESYQVNASLSVDEYLEINTEEKTIYKYDNFGYRTNLFNYRNKSYDVFKPIPCGAQNVASNGTFKVDIVVNEKRSEPKWNSSIQTPSMKNLGIYPMLQ